jgi:teichoic acid transport system permease protein
VIAAAALFSAGIGLIAARASTTLADLQQVLPHVFRILLYMSGVLFSVDAAIESQLVVNLFALNPFYCIITATRWSILGTPTGIWVPIALSIWTLVAVLAGFTWFRRGEHRYGA